MERQKEDRERSAKNDPKWFWIILILVGTSFFVICVWMVRCKKKEEERQLQQPRGVSLPTLVDTETVPTAPPLTSPPAEIVPTAPQVRFVIDNFIPYL